MAIGTEEFLTTKELAALLRVKERKVYELASNNEVPCTRAMGKLLFPRDAIERWLSESGSGFEAGDSKRRPNVFLGSHDPLLEWALRESKCGLATFFDGSLDGLDRFAGGDGVAAGLHLYESEQTWNVGTVASRFQAKPVVLVQWIWRERGWLIRTEDEGRLSDVSSLKGLRVVLRQPEAGSQQLLEQLLTDAGMAMTGLKSAGVARTETDAAVAVYDGSADVALGLESMARQYRLSFIPVIRERFDLLVDRRSWFEEPMQTFLAFCHSAAFKKRAADFSGYDSAGIGKVLFNGAT